MGVTRGHQKLPRLGGSNNAKMHCKFEGGLTILLDLGWKIEKYNDPCCILYRFIETFTMTTVTVK